MASYKLTGSEESKVRALKAANYLAARFNLKGQYIRAWNPWSEGEDNAGLAIIDCAMNTPLLFLASEISGDPRYRHIAEAHIHGGPGLRPAGRFRISYRSIRSGYR